MTMRISILAAFLCVFPGFWTSGLAGQSVVLHAGSAIDAEAVARDGDNYKITLPTLPDDVLILPVTEVLCVGQSCQAPGALQKVEQPLQSPAPRPAKGAIPPGKIEIHGSNTIGERLMPELIEAFAKANGYEAEISPGEADESSFSLSREGDQSTGSTIDLRAHGSGTAVRNMIERKAAIGMRSSPVSAAEVDEAQRAGLKTLTDPDSEHILALDGLAVIVNADNVVGALSADQISKIFAGKIVNWAELGGFPGTINVYRRDDKSGTTDTFNALVMTPNKEKMTFAAKEFEDSDKLVDSVADDKNGIGYVGWAYVRNKARALSIVTSCGVPVKPSVFTIKTGEYPLTRRLFLYTNGQPSEPLAAKLLNFVLSENAIKTVDSNGFVSRNNTFLPFDEQVQRVLQVAMARDPAPPDTRAFIQDVQAAKRASVTFHFRAGGTELDAQGIDDLDRLGKTLANDSFRNARFIVAGFTSEKEVPLEQLHALSDRRALDVTKALLNRGAKFNSENVLANGYGAGAPVACNTSVPEQSLNQRVELWVIDKSPIDRRN